jgi:hypothetical protein
MAVLCAGSGVAWGQQQEVDYRADVELVLLHVAVIDPLGRHVPPLTDEDFIVYDDSTKQNIELFVTPSDAPLDVALVLDSSASMAPVEIAARRAAITFLGRMSPDDCVYALPFSDIIQEGRWGRAADPELRHFVDSIRAAGGTSLYDAMLAGMSTLEHAEASALVAIAADAEGERPRDPESQGDAAERTAMAPTPDPPSAKSAEGGPTIELPPRRPTLLSDVGSVIRDLDLNTPPPIRGCGVPPDPGVRADASNARRKALVVLSDGADMDSDASFYDALRGARAASVPVFPVAMGYANEDPKLKANLAELARASGGRLISNTSPGGLAESYDEVVTLLRSYYLIGYDPGFADETSGRARWHEVRVELRRPNFEALVRPGYYR